MTLNPGNLQPETPKEKSHPWLPILEGLTENADWNRDLTEHGLDLLCIHDLEGNLLSVNPRPAQLLGYTMEELLRIPIRQLIAPRFLPAFEEYLHTIVRDGEASGLVAVRTRAGEKLIWEFHNTLRMQGVPSPLVRGVAHDVTDRIRIEKELRETVKSLARVTSEQGVTLRGLKLFRTLLDNSNDAIEVVDPQTMRLLDVNEKACLELGYSHDELLSMTLFDIDPEITPEIIGTRRQQLGRDGSLIVDAVHRRKDGTTFPVEVNIKHVQLEREYVISICRNVSERKRADDSVREHVDFLEKLEIVDQSIKLEADLEKMLSNVLKKTFDIFACDRVWLSYPCDPDAPSFRVPVEVTRPEFPGAKDLNVDVPMEPSIAASARAALASNGPVVQTAGTDQPVNKQAAEQFAVQSQIFMAIYPRIGKPWVFGMHQCSFPRIWTANEQKLFTEMGRRIADALSSTLFLREVKESESRFRALYERAPVGIALVESHTGKFLQVNPSYCEIVGRTQEEMLQLRYQDITHPEDKNKSDEQLAQMLEEKLPGYDLEKRYVRPDGRVAWINLSVVPMWEPGEKISYHMSIVHDFTQRRIAEEALRESEERMRLAQEVAHIGTFDRNLITGEARWTPQMEKMYGLRPGGTPKSLEQFFDLVHPSDRQRIRQLTDRSLQTGEGVGEWRVVWPNGTVRWIMGRWCVIKDAAGKPVRAIGIDYDITDRKRIEHELRVAKERLTEEKLYLEHEINTEFGFEEIIGQSRALKSVMESASRVANSDATVLLLGETGTGKELVARAIHRLSQRAGNAFIKMNCAAIPSGLLESELFGAEKGAFTGATSRKIGRLELSDKGTMFLDEIGEIDLSLQPKLLRVLQDQEFERLGGTRTIKVNFRLIAATNRDLAEQVSNNQFRRDLHYRLNVFPIHLPPLRERREDISLLVEHFVQKCAQRMGKSITSIPKKTMDTLMAWHWPGNIRELENFVERSVILTNGSVLAAPLSELQASVVASGSGNETLEAAERRHILEALRLSNGRISGVKGAAARLGLKRTTLQSKLKQLGINARTPPEN